MEERRKLALMIIIEKMVARYQNQHRNNLDEKIFVLFEKAKRVYRAENIEILMDAVKDL